MATDRNRAEGWHRSDSRMADRLRISGTLVGSSARGMVDGCRHLHGQRSADALDEIAAALGERQAVTPQPVHLACPKCSKVWHAATIQDGAWWSTSAANIAKQVWCACGQPPPMRIVEIEQPRLEFAL